jgi:hydroxymethylpyrimidine/phosphomethylpyrimidine kinase
MRADTEPGSASTLQVQVRLRRDNRGGTAYFVRMGAIHGTGPTLSAAILSALDLIGVN